jgi:glutamyl-tRNA synthetase
MEKLLVENRKILDPAAKRLFFVKDPVPLEIKGMQKKEIEIPLHPTKDLGKRKVQVEGAVYIGEADADKINEGETIRLLDFANVKIIKKTESKGIIAEEVQTKEFPEKKIQWVPEDAIKAKVTKTGPLFIGEDEETYNPDSLQVEEGLCERECLNIKEGETIQFVRYGFVRLDDKKNMEFIFSC